jgi:CheY-like chemotaxis protein
MQAPRPHSDTPYTPPTGPVCPDGPPGGRLNLLLSYAGWQPDSWADRLPRLLEPMGVRAVRADSGLEATQVIRSISPIHIAIVDLGLPLDRQGNQEGGPRLLDLLARLHRPPPTVVVKSARSHRDESRDIAAALRAGAFAVIDRPRDPTDLELLLEVLRRVLHRCYQGRWPGPSSPATNPNIA